MQRWRKWLLGCVLFGLAQFSLQGSDLDVAPFDDLFQYAVALPREDPTDSTNMNAPGSSQTYVNMFSPDGSHSSQTGQGSRSGKTVLKSLKRYKLTAENHSFSVTETVLGKQEPVILRDSRRGKRIVPMEEVKTLVRKLHNGTFPPPNTPDRIYYINMDHRYRKRAMMESWLSQSPIPYDRVRGMAGQKDTCQKQKVGIRCIGVSGLTMTNVNIIDNYNTTGITLVVEDDFVIRRMNKLLMSIHLVPPDWDVLRWDCWDDPLKQFQRFSGGFKSGPIEREQCEGRCWFCGGTHAVMWKGGQSIQKLRNIWATPPHNGVDCELTHSSLKSYCIQVGVGEFHIFESEKTDIPK